MHCQDIACSLVILEWETRYHDYNLVACNFYLGTWPRIYVLHRAYTPVVTCERYMPWIYCEHSTREHNFWSLSRYSVISEPLASMEACILWTHRNSTHTSIFYKTCTSENVNTPNSRVGCFCSIFLALHAFLYCNWNSASSGPFRQLSLSIIITCVTRSRLTSVSKQGVKHRHRASTVRLFRGRAQMRAVGCAR